MNVNPLPHEIELCTELDGLVEELKPTRLDLADVRRVSNGDLPAAFQTSMTCALVLRSVTETPSKFSGRSDIGETSTYAIVAAPTLGNEIRVHHEIVCANLEHFVR